MTQTVCVPNGCYLLEKSLPTELKHGRLKLVSPLKQLLFLFLILSSYHQLPGDGARFGGTNGFSSCLKIVGHGEQHSHIHI